MPVNRVIVESSRRILFQSKSASDAGVWRTTEDGSRIFIKDGEARAGGPNGKEISGSKKPASGDKQSSGEKPATKKNPATFAAKDMPADMAGEVEVFDPDTGQLFDTVDASAAREMFAAQMAEYGNLDGLAVRESNAEAKAERAKAEKEFWDKRDQQQAEARRQEELKTPHGLRPGHDKFVAPPKVLYHATFNADEIVSDGFKSSDDLGKQVLGGSASHLVSFTTKENAEIYRNGLEHARLAARGELSDGEMIEAATQYNVTADRARKLMIDARQSRGDASHEFFQRVAMEGKTFPLFMGGSWPEAMKTAKPAEIVGVPSADATDLYYNPGETEWRVGGYRKLNPRKAGKAKALRAGQAKSGCGANAKGGGGFQPGNTCAGGGSGDSDGGSVAVAEKRKVNPKVLAWAEGRYKDKAKAKNFAEWFGDSKVVDADGNPLVVYHGTSADFDSFKDGSNMFATNENYSYIKSSDRVIPVYLSLQNPYFTENQKDAEGVNYWDDWVAELKAKGHDGVIYSKKGDITKGASGWGNDYSQIAVFDNTAIKSAIGNRGTFASGEADITKSFDSDRMGASAVGRWLATIA